MRPLTSFCPFTLSVFVTGGADSQDSPKERGVVGREPSRGSRQGTRVEETHLRLRPEDEEQVSGTAGRTGRRFCRRGQVARRAARGTPACHPHAGCPPAAGPGHASFDGTRFRPASGGLRCRLMGRSVPPRPHVMSGPPARLPTLWNDLGGPKPGFAPRTARLPSAASYPQTFIELYESLRVTRRAAAGAQLPRNGRAPRSENSCF